MKKAIVAVICVCFAMVISGCGRNPCRTLAKEVCEKAAGTRACDDASRLTAADECADYVKNIAKFIELKNTPVTEEGVKPPAPPAPEPVVTPTDVVEPADGQAPAPAEGQAPAPAPAPAPTNAQ